jgi:ABC-2 type transport system permease protein
MRASTGAVYDRGYQRYEGPPGGRGTAALALYKSSLRRALGLRRPWRQKAAPMILLGVATLPAVINVGFAFLTRGSAIEGFEFITYREYVGLSSVLLLFVAVTAPDLVCPDRRQRVLSLLLARPMTSIDYALVKVAAVTTCVFAFSFLPQVLLFVGQTAVSKDPSGYVADNAEVLWQVPASTALLAVFYGVVSVAFASVTTRRVVASAALIGASLITGVLAGGLIESSGGDQGHLAALISLVDIPLQLNDVIFLGDLSGTNPLKGADNAILFAVLTYLGVVAAALAVVLYRYRPSVAGDDR